MELSYSNRPYNKVDYFPLSNGLVDVFLHKNERTEEDEEGNTVYVAEEIYFQVGQTITKEYIEENFDYMWDVEKNITEPTLESRLKAAEDVILFLLIGGI